MGVWRSQKPFWNIQQQVFLFFSTERKSERLQNHHCEISGVAGSDTTAGETTQILIFLNKTSTNSTVNRYIFYVSLFQLIKYWEAFLPEAKAIS